MRILVSLAIILFCYFPATSAVKTVQLRPCQRELALTGFARPRQTPAVMGEVGATVGDSGGIGELDSTFLRLELEENAIAQLQAARHFELEEKTVARYTNFISKQSAAQATYDEASLRADVLKLTIKDMKVKEQRFLESLKRHTLYGPSGWDFIEQYCSARSLLLTVLSQSSG